MNCQVCNDNPAKHTELVFYHDGAGIIRKYFVCDECARDLDTPPIKGSPFSQDLRAMVLAPNVLVTGSKDSDHRVEHCEVCHSFFFRKQLSWEVLPGEKFESRVCSGCAPQKVSEDDE